MPRASDLRLGNRSSILLKSPFGFGKTLAASSFAVEGPIHMSYWDKQEPIELDHFYRRIIKRPEILNNITWEPYSSKNANEYLNHLFDLTKSCRYFAIVNDSVTMMTSGAVNWSLGFRPDPKGKNKDKDKIMPDFDEYKVETSLVTQALDICRTLPCHVIWTCHPVPSIKIEGSGSSIRVTKTNPIVTYGSKVAGIVPGNFSEIYHFSRRSDWDQAAGRSRIRYLVNTVGTNEDDFAKSNLGLNCEMDITDRLFYEVWKDELRKLKEQTDALTKQAESNVANTNPFVKPSVTVTQELERPTNKKWDSTKGEYV